MPPGSDAADESSPPDSLSDWVNVDSPGHDQHERSTTEWIVIQEDGVSRHVEEEIVLHVSDDDDVDGDSSSDDDASLSSVYSDLEVEVPAVQFVDWVEDPSGGAARNVSGLFYNGFISNSPIYISFGLDLPDPSLSFLPGSATVMASAGGLLLCRGRDNLLYYVCNPLTREWAAIPAPINCYAASDAVLVLEDQGHYHVVAAFRIEDYDPRRDYHYDGDLEAYGFEVFSSRLWEWEAMNCVSAIVPGSGVAAAGAAHWRTKGDLVLSFATEAYTWEETPRPGFGDGGEVKWGLAEIGGRLCCSRMNGAAAEVFVLEEKGNWREIRQLEVGSVGAMEEEKLPWPMRSQGGKELLFGVHSDDRGWEVLAKGVENGVGRMMTTEGGFSDWFRNCIPYTSSSLHVLRSPEGPSNQC